jgi:hypothetical protein
MDVPINFVFLQFYAQLAPSRIAEFGSNNAIQIEVTWVMFQLHNKILAVTVNDHDTGRPVSFKDLCYKNVDGTCDLASGYLRYWNKNFTYFIESIQGSTTDLLRATEQLSSSKFPISRTLTVNQFLSCQFLAVLHSRSIPFS